MNKMWTFLMNYSTPKELTLLIYGQIGDDEYWDEVTDKKFVDELNNYKDIERINLRINSPGGVVFSGAAIANALQQHPAEVHAYIDGLCASAATLIACAADKVYMPLNGMYMIHNPAVYAFGDANNLRKAASNLDVLREGIISVYENKVNGKLTKDELITLLDEETWMTAAEAHAKGFIDEIIGSKIDTVLNKTSLSVNNLNFDMKQYKNFNRYYNKINNVQEETMPEKRNVFQKILDLLGFGGEEEIIKEMVNKVSEENKKEEIMTVEELKEKYPDVYNGVFNEGKERERERIMELEALNVIDSEVGKAIINKAKFEEVKTAGEVAVMLLSSPELMSERTEKKIKSENGEVLAAISTDASGLKDLSGGAFTPELKLGESTDDKLEEAQKRIARNARMAAEAKKQMGVK